MRTPSVKAASGRKAGVDRHSRVAWGSPVAVLAAWGAEGGSGVACAARVSEGTASGGSVSCCVKGVVVGGDGDGASGCCPALASPGDPVVPGERGLGSPIFFSLNEAGPTLSPSSWVPRDLTLFLKLYPKKCSLLAVLTVEPLAGRMP